MIQKIHDWCGSRVGGWLRSVCAVPALVLLLNTPASADPSSPLQPLDVFALEVANDPQISPDGTKVAYVHLAADMMKDQYKPTLWVVDADGENAHAVAGFEAASSEPSWSPDSQKLAYVTTCNEAPCIVVRQMTDGTDTVISGFVTPPSDLSWSPDGKLIAFAMFVPAPPRTIGKEITPPEGATWKPGTVVIDRGYYRADGIGNIPAGAQHLFVVPALGGEIRQVSKEDSGYPPFSGRMYTWLPDSKALVAAFIHKSEFEILQGAMYDTGLFLLPIDGSDTQTLIDEIGPEGSPAVSPDGRYVAYTGYPDEGRTNYTISKLSVLDLKTGKTHILTADFDHDVFSPAWESDGSGIYGMYVERGTTRLARFDLQGRHKDIVGGLGMMHTAYSAEPSFSVARDGALALQWTSPYSSGNIAVVDAERNPLRLVTDLNEALLSDRTLGRVEEINYTSSAGNLPIQGWIVYPPEFDPTKKYPLILEIHGGPETNYGPRFDIEKQLMAAAGYVVLYVNPRGSTSYGQEFINLINNNFPGLEYEDLMSGVDAVLARGFIDPNRLFVTGGSGGGTLTAWLISKTDRFRAAVVMYPVIEWRSQALTSDILPVVFKGFFHGTPWNQPEEYARRSLLNNVDKVTTPTLIMTGEADYRTPISQSEQYYASLKYYGVDSVFVRVPMENHGIRMFPSHFAAKLTTLIGWFDDHQGNIGDERSSVLH